MEGITFTGAINREIYYEKTVTTQVVRFTVQGSGLFSLTASQAASSSGGVSFFVLLDIVDEPS